MQLSKPQSEIAQDTHRFKVVIAGRRFGKTTLAIRELCYNARLPNKDIFYITSSYRAAKMIVWRPLKARLIELRWVKKINEAELSIVLVNGSTISLKGAENYDALRGVSLDYTVFDEVASIDPNTWTEVIRPALADKQGRAMFIGTPQGKSNWSYELYCMSELYPDTWKSWQFTTAQGGFVTDSELEQARADMSERQFRQEFLASFETDESRVAWAYERDLNMAEALEWDTSIIHVGMDFNTNPLVASIQVKQGEELYTIDEIVLHSSHTQEMADEIQNRYPRSKVFVYPDPSGSRRQTSSGGLSDHAILTNAGFIVKSPRKHDPVRDRINAINARFCSAEGKRYLYISKSCKYTIESLEKYSFKPNTQIPDKDSGWDHMFDALSYCVAYLFPLRKEVERGAPERWGHRLA